MTQVFARDKKGDCGKWVDSACLDNYVTDSKCENEKLVLIYSDGTEKATSYDCKHTEDTRLETNGQPVVNPDGSTTINFNVVNVETGEVVDTEQQIIPADDECVEYAAGTPLKDQSNPVLHGCGDDGKGSIPLCDLNVEPAFITKCVSSGDQPEFDAIYVDGSMSTGSEYRIDYLPNDDITHPISDAEWIPHTTPLYELQDQGTNNSGVPILTATVEISVAESGRARIDDPELVESGGLVRVGVKSGCGWEWSVQSVSSCVASKKATGVKPQKVMLGSDYSFGDCEGLDWNSFVKCVRCSMGCDVNVSPQPSPQSISGMKSISAGFHTTMLKTIDGVSVSGERAAADGTDQLVLTEITGANGYNYTGEIIDFDAGGFSFYSILTSDGLWWGGGQAAEAPFQQMTLPAGVSPAEILSYDLAEPEVSQSSPPVFTILTSDGRVVVSSGVIGGASDSNGWYEQPISDVKKMVPILTAGDDRIGGERTKWLTMFAEKHDGTLWTWGGGSEFLGNGSSPALIATPTEMINPLPSGVAVAKLAGVQKSTYSLAPRSGINYQILGTNGKVYSMGNGRYGLNGQGDELNHYEWVTVKDDTGAGDLSGVIDISSVNSTFTVPYSMIMMYDGSVRSWGRNHEATAGSPVNGSVLLPRKPDGFSGTASAISAGGHISPILNSNGWYCNIGHNQGGGFGDGTTDDREAYECYPIPVDVPLNTVEISIKGCKDGDCVNVIDYTDAEGNPATIELECC